MEGVDDGVESCAGKEEEERNQGVEVHGYSPRLPITKRIAAMVAKMSAAAAWNGTATKLLNRQMSKATAAAKANEMVAAIHAAVLLLIANLAYAGQNCVRYLVFDAEDGKGRLLERV